MRPSLSTYSWGSLVGERRPAEYPVRLLGVRLEHPALSLARAAPVDRQVDGQGAAEHTVGVVQRRDEQVEGVPGALVHDDGLRHVEGAAQPVDVLVMMERIAARPIDQADVGIAVLGAMFALLLGLADALPRFEPLP